MNSPLNESGTLPLTLTAKLLLAHQDGSEASPGYLRLKPDRVDMQDATAQMAMLQLMSTGLSRARIAGAIHCDHLIVASTNREADLEEAEREHEEVYEFLREAARRYGLAFWPPGSGIIHQNVLENHAFPGGLMIGTDSHTPNCGGLTMLGVGVGGAEAVDALVGLPWEIPVPRVLGIELKGSLRGWVSAKDVILHLAGLLGCDGATGNVIEYFGPGVASIPCSGRATICNMGAELGATSSVFPCDERTLDYLRATGRSVEAELAVSRLSELRSDPGCRYDRVIEIDLDGLEASVNGPFSPDRRTPLSRFASEARTHGWPDAIRTCFIGSCTNSSYEDITRVAELARAALAEGLRLKTRLVISPGSQRLEEALERDGALAPLRELGATLLTSACGPCVGQWKSEQAPGAEPCSIMTSFNRNFAGRNDGNSRTHAFLASLETVFAFALAGKLSAGLPELRPSSTGAPVALSRPALPARGLPGAEPLPEDPHLLSAPSAAPLIRPDSERLQMLRPFEPYRLPEDFQELRVLVKVRGKCTTDQISPAGPWYRFRGHLDRISDNFLIGATNAFNSKLNRARNALDGTEAPIPELARAYRAAGTGWVVIADENYGEGSSREHAALEARYLGGRAIIARSFARIHESNLKKQGVLPLRFQDSSDYERIREDDLLALDPAALVPGQGLTLTCAHADGSIERIRLSHTLNARQIEWLRAGSALNHFRGSGGR